jgi:hypothetical protein
MKKITLHNGLVAKFDNASFEIFSRFKLKDNGKYVFRVWRGRELVTNREVLGLGRISGGQRSVVHKNGDRLDLRKSNLRLLTHSEKNHLSNHKRASSSEYRGVCKVKNRNLYKAQIGKEGVIYYLGYFKNPEDAAKAYNKKAKELYGEFAYQNS